jgi:WhiB family redox-sensing transcriptional regulator
MNLRIPTFAAPAACAGMPTDVFYPVMPKRQEETPGTRRAKGICSGCKARDECLAWALQHDERHGVWGATTPRQRQRIKAGAA